MYISNEIRGPQSARSNRTDLYVDWSSEKMLVYEIILFILEEQ